MRPGPLVPSSNVIDTKEAIKSGVQSFIWHRLYLRVEHLGEVSSRDMQGHPGKIAIAFLFLVVTDERGHCWRQQRIRACREVEASIGTLMVSHAAGIEAVLPYGDTSTRVV
jgi:hypothetical protein